MSIGNEYEELAITLKASDDLQAISNALKFLANKKYRAGYRDGFSDRNKAHLASERSLSRDFDLEREIIEDVMSSPFEVDHQ
jgi:hypothetical protein